LHACGYTSSLPQLLNLYANSTYLRCPWNWYFPVLFSFDLVRQEERRFMFDGPHLRGHEYQMNFRFDPFHNLFYYSKALQNYVLNTFSCLPKTTRKLKLYNYKWSCLKVSYKNNSTCLSQSLVVSFSDFYPTQCLPNHNLGEIWRKKYFFFAKNQPKHFIINCCLCLPNICWCHFGLIINYVTPFWKMFDSLPPLCNTFIPFAKFRKLNIHKFFLEIRNFFSTYFWCEMSATFFSDILIGTQFKKLVKFLEVRVFLQNYGNFCWFYCW
jgi:hypothetical protein